MAEPWGLWATQPIPVVTETVPDTVREPERPAGVHLVAAVGVVLVLYSYLAALWPSRHAQTPDLVLLAREWLNFPLGIGSDFGLLGIGLLLAAAGFWATGRTADGGGLRLAWVAVARGYLPYVLACTIAWLLLLGGAQPLTSPRQVDPDGGGYLANLALVDRLVGAGGLLGLGWAVAVAGCFGVLLAATAALVSRSGGNRWLGLLGVGLQLAVVAAVSLTAAGTGGWYQQLGVLLSLCVFPLVGSLVWVARAGGAGTGWPAGLLGVGCLAVLIGAERGYPQLSDSWLALTLVFVGLSVLLAAQAAARGGPLDGNQVVRWLATRAFPAGLLVCAIGYPLLGAFGRAGLPLGLTVPVACAVTLGIAEIVYRLSGVLAR